MCVGVICNLITTTSLHIHRYIGSCTPVKKHAPMHAYEHTYMYIPHNTVTCAKYIDILKRIIVKVRNKGLECLE